MSAKIDVQTEDLRLLVGCVTEGSLSAAARGLGLTQAAASRRLQRLEAAVGGPVLHRTTRALRPTATGERLLAAARRMLAELGALADAAEAEREAPVGEVHVSAPVLLGQAMGAALACELHRLHPALRLRLSLSNQKVDLVRADVDVALRVGATPASTVVATLVATAHEGAYGGGDLAIAAHHPSALLALPWIGLPSETTLRATGPDGQRWTGTVAPRFISDDRVVLRDAAQAGLGAVLLPTFLGDACPGLRRLAPRWWFSRVPIRALCLPAARRDPRVRAVIDAVVRLARARSW